MKPYYMIYRGFPGLTIKEVRSENLRNFSPALSMVFRQGTDEPIAELRTYTLNEGYGKRINIALCGKTKTHIYETFLNIETALAWISNHFQLKG